MRAYGGEQLKLRAFSTLALDGGRLTGLYPGGRRGDSVYIGQEAICVLLKRGKSLILSGDLILYCPARMLSNARSFSGPT